LHVPSLHIPQFHISYLNVPYLHVPQLHISYLGCSPIACSLPPRRSYLIVKAFHLRPWAVPSDSKAKSNDHGSSSPLHKPKQTWPNYFPLYLKVTSPSMRVILFLGLGTWVTSSHPHLLWPSNNVTPLDTPFPLHINHIHKYHVSLVPFVSLYVGLSHPPPSILMSF
jgi:hypothetical protein